MKKTTTLDAIKIIKTTDKQMRLVLAAKQYKERGKKFDLGEKKD